MRVPLSNTSNWACFRTLNSHPCEYVSWHVRVSALCIDLKSKRHTNMCVFMFFIWNVGASSYPKSTEEASSMRWPDTDSGTMYTETVQLALIQRESGFWLGLKCVWNPALVYFLCGFPSIDALEWADAPRTIHSARWAYISTFLHDSNKEYHCMLIFLGLNFVVQLVRFDSVNFQHYEYVLMPFSWTVYTALDSLKCTRRIQSLQKLNKPEFICWWRCVPLWKRLWNWIIIEVSMKWLQHACVWVCVCVYAMALEVIGLCEADNNVLLADREEELGHKCIKCAFSYYNYHNHNHRRIHMSII